MSLKEVAKMTGLSEHILMRMRTRNSHSLKSGPPFCKKLINGELVYIYDRIEVKKWLEQRHCLITALDAAQLLGISREELLNFYGLKSFDIRQGRRKSKLIIQNSKNIYIWIRKKAA